MLYAVREGLGKLTKNCRLLVHPLYSGQKLLHNSKAMNNIHQASIKYLTLWIQNKRQVDNKQDTHTKPTYRREALHPLSATKECPFTAIGPTGSKSHFLGTKHHNHFSLLFWEDEKYSQENQIILELHKIMSSCIDEWNYYNMVARIMIEYGLVVWAWHTRIKSNWRL